MIRELFNNLINCKTDEDFGKLGYNKTEGQLIELLNCKEERDIQDLCRLWVYKDEKINHSIVIVDEGNSYGHYLCEYYEGITVAKIRIKMKEA